MSVSHSWPSREKDGAREADFVTLTSRVLRPVDAESPAHQELTNTPVKSYCQRDCAASACEMSERRSPYAATGSRRTVRDVLPKEARDGLMRVWLEILRERHPAVIWIDAGVESGVE